MPGISFAYPSTWNATAQSVPRHYETVLGLLGDGSFAEACPSDAQPGEFNTCVEQLSLEPDTVVVKVSSLQLPTPAHMTEVQYQQWANPSAMPMLISGQRGVRQQLGEPMSGADEHWQWMVDVPGTPWEAYTIEAWLRGPHLDALRAQVDALVASMTVQAPAP